MVSQKRTWIVVLALVGTGLALTDLTRPPAEATADLQLAVDATSGSAGTAVSLMGVSSDAARPPPPAPPPAQSEPTPGCRSGGRGPLCEVSDNGTGTVDLPPLGCQYLSPNEVHLIIDGLPPGTTIELAPIHWEFFNVNTLPGGSLGGEIEIFQSVLDLTVTGTGQLAGFSRNLSVLVSCEVHTGPRNPGDPVQTFPNEMYRLDGQLFGDPDFCTLRVLGGSDYGLPSPGQTTLTDLGNGWYNVDSFFDISYQIEFQGCPGSILDGFAGTTMATLRMETGQPAANAEACCLSDGTCQDLIPSTCTGAAMGPGTACWGDYNNDGIDDICDPDLCNVPDNGTGTVTLPPAGCDYLSPDEVHLIIDGLPPGTTIELDPIHMDFICGDQPHPLCTMALAPGECEAVGGSLGGHGDCFESTLDLTVTGTGDLAGFSRHLAVPIFCEVHTGPRNPGDPVQTFPAEMIRVDGELFGDPDFCMFRVIGGTGNSLPSPGQTTLTQLPTGNFAVDSFFDVSYQIEFQGCPGSQLDGYMGITTATIRMETGHPPAPPQACCFVATGVCQDLTEADCLTAGGNPQGPGTACSGTTVACCLPGGGCQEVDPVCCDDMGGTPSALSNICLGDYNNDDIDDACDPDLCKVLDNGSGTVTLPPIGCDYLSPGEVHLIIDGLPPGTTIELDPIHMDFICSAQALPLCTMPLAPGECETPGGSLGGHGDCFESTLDLTVTGTGDLAGFNRHLAVPIFCEIHTGPRNPGDPVQTFPAEMFRLNGELFGDPDFCTLRVFGGADYGLPSPGETTLTQLPDGDFAVDSFFDVSYQIEFWGCPGSQLDGYMGTTTATIRMETGHPPAAPQACCFVPAGTCQDLTEADCLAAGGTPQGPGTACSGITVACCLTGGVCVDVDPLCCDDMGGTPSTLSNVCLGDYNNDSIDDACDPDLCKVPDNGNGTVNLPPIGCDYLSPDEVHLIINGLPPGTTIELEPIHLDFLNVVATPGGTLGGEIETFDSTLDLDVTGTGGLAGFNRHLFIPISCEVHTGPRTPGDPVQMFPNDMFRMDGELFGDPDFCTFRVFAGTFNGLPSPGQTALTQLPDGDFAVDSFFDVSYQIEFQGCPGSQLDGYMGTTTATIRMQTGHIENLPQGCCFDDGSCQDLSEPACATAGGASQGPGTACSGTTIACCLPGGGCQEVDPLCCDELGGTPSTLSNICLGDYNNDSIDDACDPDLCKVPDNGSGTVDLPPQGCDYLSPDEVHMIIDGLPPGTTIELDPIHLDFINVVATPGGALGGEIETFDSTLDLTVTGTGSLAGFNRHLFVPITCEAHTGPRTPGNPVQTFPNDMFRMDGELFGDPDFCTFRVFAGTYHGLPSPGETALTQLPDGDFAVDSFFDVSYQIEFQGCPGSQLDTYAGITTATIRMQVGHPRPLTDACCFSTGACGDLPPADCIAYGGNPQGAGTTCATTNCQVECTCPGDLNLDGLIDGSDIGPFIDVMLNQGQCP